MCKYESVFETSDNCLIFLHSYAGKYLLCRSVAISKDSISLISPLVNAFAGIWSWAMSTCECKCRHITPQMIPWDVLFHKTNTIGDAAVVFKANA